MFYDLQLELIVLYRIVYDSMDREFKNKNQNLFFKWEGFKFSIQWIVFLAWILKKIIDSK